MVADDTTTSPARQRVAASVPEQSRRRAAASPTDRILRQVQAIDAWVAGRRERERALQAGRWSRDERMDVARELEVLRLTHEAIKDRCCARDLDHEIAPMRLPGLTAVIAHRHAWFADKLTLLLGTHGVAVVVCTDNGAQALGAVVAEQPDFLLVGDRLAMMPGRALLVEARRYAPGTVLAAQAGDPDQADGLQCAADAVFLRHHPPAAVSEALVALHLSRR